MPRRRKTATRGKGEAAFKLSTYALREHLDVEIGELVDPAHKYEFPAITGNCVWDAGAHLARWIAKQEPELFARRRCVELGAGLGLPGIAAACCGASVALTDLPANVPALQNNIRLNGETVLSASGAIVAEELDWSICQKGGKDAIVAIRRVIDALGGPPQILLASDVTWSSALCPPLLAAMQELIATAHPETVEVHIAHTSRHGWGKEGEAAEGESTFHLGPLLRNAGFRYLGETKIGDPQGTYIWHYASA